MSDTNPSASPAPRNTRTGSTRRLVLSMIPAAMLAAWQGLAIRPKAALGAATAPDGDWEITAAGYSYTAARITAAEPAAPAASECIAWTTTYTFDEHDQVVEERTFGPDGSMIYRHRAGVQAQT